MVRTNQPYASPICRGDRCIPDHVMTLRVYYTGLKLGYQSVYDSVGMPRHHKAIKLVRGSRIRPKPMNSRFITIFDDIRPGCVPGCYHVHVITTRGQLSG